MSKTDGIGTWLWNEKPTFSDDFSYSVSFSSNSKNYSNISAVWFRMYIDYDSDRVFDIRDTPSWADEAYRTIDIKTAPPAEFLTILQANAVYQEPAVVTPKYLDADALKQFAAKTKAYVDGRTKSRITNVVIDDTAKTIKLTIE